MWNRMKLMQLVGKGEDAVRWCQDNGLLPRAVQCRRCRQPMTFEKNHGGLGNFCCRRGQCNECISLLKNTWFENSKLNLLQVLSFATNETYERAQREAFDHKTGTLLSVETIWDWYNYCREIVTADFALEEAGQVGDSDVVRLWQRDLKKRDADPFEALLSAIKRRYPQRL